MAEIEDLLNAGGRRAFDKLFERRILFLRGPLEDENADTMVAQMLALEGVDPEEDIF